MFFLDILRKRSDVAINLTLTVTGNLIRVIFVGCTHADNQAKTSLKIILHV